MDGLSPDQAFAKCMVKKHTLPDYILRWACMPRFCPQRVREDGSIVRGVQVGRHGVTWRGLNFGGFSPEVQALFGQCVMLAINNSDVSYVVICGLDGRLICKAQSNLRLGVMANSQDVRDAHAEKYQLRRTLKAYRKAQPRMSHDLHQLVTDAGRRKRAAQRQVDTSPPPTIVPHRTPFDDQFAAIRRAVYPNRAPAKDHTSELDDLRPRGAFPRVVGADDVQGGEDEIDTFGAISAALNKRRAQ